MTTQVVPDRLALPPPREFDLIDANRAVGWVAGETVGFRGFADETEATHAAWIAHRTLARRLARTHGTRPVPIDIEPLALERVEGKEMIVASGEPIASLVRRHAGSRSGVESFGFELTIPSPTTELEVRAIALLIYRTLRKSGVRWSLWRPEVVRTAARATQPGAEAANERSQTVVNGGTSGAIDRSDRRAWKFPSVPSWRELARLTRHVLPALAVSATAVLVGPVSRPAIMTLTVILLASIGLGAVMSLRSRRLQ